METDNLKYFSVLQETRACYVYNGDGGWTEGPTPLYNRPQVIT